MKKEELNLDLINIHSKIQEEYENFKNHQLFNTQKTDVSRFDMLYEFFKRSPDEGIKVETLVDRDPATNWKTYFDAKNAATESVYRIKKAYKNYRKRNASDVEFVIEYEHYNLSWIDEKKGLKYLLKVFYKDINYSDILEKYSKGIDLGYGISVRVHLSPFPFELRAFVIKYLKCVVLDHRYLEIKGFGILPSQEVNFEIDEVYISVQANKKLPSSATSDITSYRKKHPEIPASAIPEENNIKGFSKQQAQPVESILQDAFESRDLQKRHIVILGFSGSGKSTILSFLALSSARGSLKNLNLEGFLPLFINLRDYVDDNNKGLIKFGISKVIQNLVDDELKSGIKSCLEHCLRSCANNCEELYGLVIILDALDETGDSRPSVAKEIEKIRNRYPKALIIVSSRTIDYYDSPLNGFNIFQLENLRPLDIKKLIRLWFKLLSKKYSGSNHRNDTFNWSDNRSNYIVDKIVNSPNLLNISRRPLYLTYLILLASDPKFELPHNLNTLYFKFFNKLIRNWEKKHHFPASTYAFNFYFEGFIEVCWIVHNALFGDKTNDHQFIRLCECLKTFPNSDSHQLIDFLLKAGIFEIVQDSDQNEFLMPTHLSFLDYGFACMLAQMWNDLNKRDDLWKDLKINLHNEHLTDCLEIFISQLREPMSFFERVLSEPNDLFNRNLIFLARILNQVKNDPKVTKIFKTLLHKFHEIYLSKCAFIDPIKPEILKSIYLLDGTDLLIKLFQIETKQHLLSTIIDYITLLNDKAAIPKLKEFCSREIPADIKIKICCCISNIGDPDFANSLIKKLYNKLSKLTRNVSSTILYESGDRNLVPLLNDILDTEIDIYDRYYILGALANFASPKEALSLFKEQYKKGIDLDSKRVVINAIYTYKRLEAIPLLLEFYRERNTKEEIKSSILDAISMLGGRTTLNFFKELYKFESESEMQFNIVKMIGYLGDTEFALPILKEKYHKTKVFRERVQIADTIGWFKETRLSIKLLKELYKAEEAELYNKKDILFSIFFYGDPDFAIPRMEKLYHEETISDDKIDIAFLLGRMGKKTLAETLLITLFKKEKDIRLKVNIAYTLERIEGKEKKLALSLLIKAYNETSDNFIKGRIVYSIGEYGNQTSIQFLKNMYDKENDPDIKLEIAKSLYKISKSARVLIFEDKKGRWKLVQIPKKYVL